MSTQPDGAVEPQVAAHLNGCAACQGRFTALMATADVSARALGVLDREAPDVDINQAYGSFRATLAGQPAVDIAGGSRMGQIFAQRPLRAASAVVAVIAVVAAMTFTPMRTMADDFLNQFRVQSFAAITIPMDMLSPLQSAALDGMSAEDKQRFHDEMNELGAFDTTFEFDMENLPASTSLEDAEAQFGAIDVPDDLPDGFDSAPNAYVTEAGSASYTLNTANVNALIAELGLPIYALPDADLYPTLEFTANVPAGAFLEYTNADGKKILVGQMASPTLDIPDGVDMDLLREDILRFPGLPADLVAQLRSIEDWESTLIIPIPEEATSDDITINGEPGLLIEHHLGSAVLWEKDGILYAVIGQASDDEVRDIADSMQ